MSETDQPDLGRDQTTRRRDSARRERLAAALRQNLARRKAQSRARESLDLGDSATPANTQD